jgi:hypothetical protein
MIDEFNEELELKSLKEREHYRQSVGRFVELQYRACDVTVVFNSRRHPIIALATASIADHSYASN